VSAFFYVTRVFACEHCLYVCACVCVCVCVCVCMHKRLVCVCTMIVHTHMTKVMFFCMHSIMSCLWTTTPQLTCLFVGVCGLAPSRLCGRSCVDHVTEESECAPAGSQQQHISPRNGVNVSVCIV